MLKMKKINNH